jgi:tetratricopeptide (TPR) repeat protein
MQISRAAAFCLCLVSAPAWAVDDPGGAREHFEEGTRAYNLGEFKHAAEEYREAYRLKPDPALLYNIGQAYRLDKNVEQALFFYRSYLRNTNDPSHREEVEQRIAALEQQQKQQQAPPNEVVKPSDTTPATNATHSQPATTTTTRADLVATPLARRPFYKRWWLWTGVGVVVVGASLGVGLGLGLKASGPSSQLGNLRVF